MIIYYWDDRDGPEFRGWWFGNTLAGAQATGQHRDRHETAQESSNQQGNIEIVP